MIPILLLLFSLSITMKDTIWSHLGSFLIEFTIPSPLLFISCCRMMTMVMPLLLQLILPIWMYFLKLMSNGWKESKRDKPMMMTTMTVTQKGHVNQQKRYNLLKCLLTFYFISYACLEESERYFGCWSM